ncbi:hypothetical protein L3Q82_004774 [Scortum barcoo]|uniref:Uncharacterized protein n=1 Tax=Scortum barcoo TaxID=214431 RepID=A0ACB8VHC0_9TELE|nr:hypothetical protein L3Q82_004774 [Scortum barcoo]
MGSDLPVYEVRPERGKGRSRVLHRNLLMPCDHLPFEKQPELAKHDQSKQKKKHQPAFQPQESDEDSGDEYDFHREILPFTTVPAATDENYTRPEMEPGHMAPPVRQGDEVPVLVSLPAQPLGIEHLKDPKISAANLTDEEINLPARSLSDEEINLPAGNLPDDDPQREEEESCVTVEEQPSCCAFVSGRPEGSSLYQLWTLVLQTVHQLILGPVCFIRRLLLSPVWRKIQNQELDCRQPEVMKQEVKPSSTGSTLSSTSQRDRVKRFIPNMRELNLIKDEQYSLLMLLHVFHPTLQKVTAEQLAVCKLLFIFDGLDESRLSLDFSNSEVVSDVTQKSSVNVLLTNLIKGNLLPSALVWITSRPAAANQIPPECVDRVTEVRGFTDAQKEEYFRRRVSDEDLSSRIISHIKTSRTLHIMCQIPVFCWITATVLDHMLTTDQRGELPKTLTDLYSHFLLVQTKRKKQKYDEGHETSPQELMEADRKLLLKLGRLAFEHLEKGNIMFYQEDLEQCGLDVTEASVYSGVCTEIFKKRVCDLPENSSTALFI